jgi:AraC-like DNA-binding protein
VRYEDPAILWHAERSRPFIVHRFPVGPPLSRSLEYIWSVQWHLSPGQVHEQEVLTHPSVHVAIEDGRVDGTGVVTTRFLRRLTGSGWVLGIRFRAGAFSAASSVPPADLVDRQVPAEQVLGPWWTALQPVSKAPGPSMAAEMATRALAGRLPVPLAGAHLVDEAVALVQSDPGLIRVDALAERLGATVRTLQRRFVRHLGVGPKWVIQRQRIQDALATIETGQRVDWGALAVELGFVDQAHLTRTFTSLVGTSPAAYKERAAH